MELKAAVLLGLCATLAIVENLIFRLLRILLQCLNHKTIVRAKGLTPAPAGLLIEGLSFEASLALHDSLIVCWLGRSRSSRLLVVGLILILSRLQHSTALVVVILAAEEHALESAIRGAAANRLVSN